MFSGNLWKNKDFLRLWAGLSVSLIGTEVTVLALPTLALMMLGASSSEVGLLRAMETISFPLLGMIAGVIADRRDPRKIMEVSNIFRLVVLASVPVVALVGHLTMAQLFIVALVVGVFSVFFNVSYSAYFPALVPEEDLGDGNAKISLSQSVAQVTGPAIAGWLIGLVGAAISILLDAFGYLFSACMLFLIKKPIQRENKTAQQAGFWEQMKEGIKLVFQTPVLRWLMFATGCINFGFSMVQPMLLVFAYQSLHLKPGQMGIILGLGSAGFIVGALVANRITNKLGVGRALLLGTVMIGGSMAGLVLAAFGAPEVMLTAFWFLTSFAMPIYDINSVTLRQSVTPIELQGRMNATMRTVIWGALPLGSIVGGLITDHVSVKAAIVIGGGIAILASLLVIVGPLIKVKTIQSRTKAVAAETTA